MEVSLIERECCNIKSIQNQIQPSPVFSVLSDSDLTAGRPALTLTSTQIWTPGAYVTTPVTVKRRVIILLPVHMRLFFDSPPREVIPNPFNFKSPRHLSKISDQTQTSTLTQTPEAPGEVPAVVSALAPGFCSVVCGLHL